jgi:hypothetical protein
MLAVYADQNHLRVCNPYQRRRAWELPHNSHDGQISSYSQSPKAQSHSHVSPASALVEHVTGGIPDLVVENLSPNGKQSF